ncbi:MAG: hypothetical protein ABI612_24560, partial [Betaproteobacteria bacterium]
MAGFRAEEAGTGSIYDIPRVRELCNFTTHTPVETAHDQFPYDLVRRIMGDGSVANFAACRERVSCPETIHRSATMIDFKGRQFEREIILWGVRWYVAY